MESIKNLREINVINKEHAGTFLRQSYMDNLDDVYEKVAKKWKMKYETKVKKSESSKKKTKKKSIKIS